MHRLAAIPGGWNQEAEGVIFIEQTPAPIIFLTSADTDIQTLAAAVSKLPEAFPALRVVNILQLQQQLSIDTYAEEILEQAQVIILRLLGGRAYWSYGLEVVRETAQRTQKALIVLPGDDRPDPDLISHSNVSLFLVNQIWRYLSEGGCENFVNALKFVADNCLGASYNPPPPQEVPRVGVWRWEAGVEGVGEWGSRGVGEVEGVGEWGSRGAGEAGGAEGAEGVGEWGSRGAGEAGEAGEKVIIHSSNNPQSPVTSHQSPVNSQQSTVNSQQSTVNNQKVGVLFYRAHYLAGNTAPIEALCVALAARNLEPVPVFVSSLRDAEVQAELGQYFLPSDAEGIQILLNTTSFSVTNPDDSNPKSKIQNLKLDVPVLQVIFSSGTVDDWEENFKGLSPRDIAMNVALPEVDGRIISRAVSFKTAQIRNAQLETDVVVYQPVSDRINFVADLAANWIRLRQTPVSERKIALILANYPSRDGRLANGVGLDTPNSCVEILRALKDAGYYIEGLPTDGDELINWLTAGVTNDSEGRELRPILQSLSVEEYLQYFDSLPQKVQQEIGERWGDLRINHSRPEGTEEERRERVFDNKFAISGVQLGNVFVGIQPARGYDIDPSLNYHAPDLEPTHEYLGFYYWLRKHFEALAIVHVGKHGNLEWLPGKSVALSGNCYPEIAFGAMPHLYPFIVNDPGEGSQAKRRAQAVIIDHLTPPMTRAELYGSLQVLEGLIDEYYEAQSLDPSRLPVIRDRITKLVVQEQLYQDLGIENTENNNFDAIILNSIDGYLCELKEAQIRDGLHIFGQCPQGRQLRDLIVAIARHPGINRIGLTRAIAQAWQLDFDPLITDPTKPILDLESSISDLIKKWEISNNKPRNVGDVITLIEEEAANLVEQLIAGNNSQSLVNSQQSTLTSHQSPLNQELAWICSFLLPSLEQTNQEIIQLLRGLDGRFVPSGPSGAPTRGRPEVLPTGRNFYSVDIRAIPTETAWSIGRKAAEALIERYTQENGEYPQTLGLSIWGTSTMRTGGDDIAEALALLGVQPVWDGSSRRVVDFEILPVSILGRPRVDVTLRISGFFRDAFPNLIDLFDRAVKAVAALDEPPEQNPLAAQVKAEVQLWEKAGLNTQEALKRSRYRIFGSKPGAYGAGLQGLMEAQNWQDDQDLARAYINWSCYAYTSETGNREQGAEGAEGTEGAGEVGEWGSRGEKRDKVDKENTFPSQPSPANSQPSPVNRQPSTVTNPNPKSKIQNPKFPVAAPEAFEQRLRQMQIVLHNQDNREHDLLDSDDYYQFQGGLTASVRALTGKNPQTYFGDNSIPENPKVRQLQAEIARVYRSRVVNPKWIAGVMRHGYKGAFEMAATVDYLFAYDATANCVQDFMYQGVAEAYIFDPQVQEFIGQKNPWALRDMAERLLEANLRGLWQKVEQKTLDELRAIVHQAEAIIEGKLL